MAKKKTAKKTATKKTPAAKKTTGKVAPKAAKKVAKKTTPKATKKAAATKKTKPAVKTAAKKKTATPKKVKSAVKTKPEKTSTTPTKAAVSTADLVLGKTIDQLSLPMTGGQTFNIKDYAGKKVVLYFYPKDMTPGCTQEGHEFTELAPEFGKLNTVVLGISRDPVAMHEKFIQKENYKINLLSDGNETACKLFDVIKEKNMYGKKVMGIERSTFLLGEDGKVVKAWRKVKVEGHAAEVLAAVKSL